MVVEERVRLRGGSKGRKREPGEKGDAGDPQELGRPKAVETVAKGHARGCDDDDEEGGIGQPHVDRGRAHVDAELGW